MSLVNYLITLLMSPDFWEILGYVVLGVMGLAGLGYVGSLLIESIDFDKVNWEEVIITWAMLGACVNGVLFTIGARSGVDISGMVFPIIIYVVGLVAIASVAGFI